MYEGRGIVRFSLLFLTHGLKKEKEEAIQIIQ